MELNAQTIRKRLRKLRRLQISGTHIGLRNQVKKLSEEIAEMVEALKPAAKPKTKPRESDAGQDREEQGGHDRSDS